MASTGLFSTEYAGFQETVDGGSGQCALVLTSSAVCFGDCRNSTGNLGTDQLYTGQRLDGTGLYFYNARYYDASIGRFISPDTVVQVNPGESSSSIFLTVGFGGTVTPVNAVLFAPLNPQNLNRYSYVTNNPLRYTDPTGNLSWWRVAAAVFVAAAAVTVAIVIVVYAAPAIVPALQAEEGLLLLVVTLLHDAPSVALVAGTVAGGGVGAGVLIAVGDSNGSEGASSDDIVPDETASSQNGASSTTSPGHGLLFSD